MNSKQTTLVSGGTEKLRATFERNAKALQLRPGLGQGTALTKVTLRDGLHCDIEEGRWKLVADLAEKSGGNSAGPNPGILGRAALGSCLAIGYAMWAAKLEVPLDEVTVEVQADYDSRGMYGVGDVTPGYREIRYVVHVQSNAPESDVLRVLDEADAHSDFLYVFRDPQAVRREVRLERRET